MDLKIFFKKTIIKSCFYIIQKPIEHSQNKTCIAD